MSLFGRRRPRQEQGILLPAAAEFLLTGSIAEGAPDDVVAFLWATAPAEALWRAHRVPLMAEAKRRGVSPFALWLFEGREAPGVPVWRRHFADPRPMLAGREVIPCPHCGSRDVKPTSCLGPAKKASAKKGRE